MLYGVDVHARYQGGLDIPLLKRQGYSYLVAKASEGTSIPPLNGSSAQFKARTLRWMDETREQAMIPGLYHWIKGGNAAAQARFFHSIVKDAEGPAGMLIQLDCEDNATYSDLQVWKAEWQQLANGHPFELYTGKWWWGPRGWNGNLITPYLWDSHYLTADTDTIPDNPAQYPIPPSWWTPGYGSWPTATILQFTSRGDAGSLGNNVDLNAFRGTFADLQALAGGGPPIGDKTMWFLNVKGQQAIFVSDGQNTRGMPGGTYPTTIEPLTRLHGVPHLEYLNMDELLKAGGPLVKDADVTITDEQLAKLAVLLAEKVTAQILDPMARAYQAASGVIAAEVSNP